MKTEELIEQLLSGNRFASRPDPKQEVKLPSIKEFMANLVKDHWMFAKEKPVRWAKTFRQHQNGKEYTVTIELREEP